MTTIVLAHGAWSSAWAWRRVRPLMREAGHEFFTPSLTGLGQRAHLARPDLDLDAHIADVMAAIEAEELQDVVLLGHSYGGMVATGVADRLRGRVARVIYLDAFVPRDGEAVFDLVPADAAEQMETQARDADGWRVPPNPPPPDTAAEDLAWLEQHRVGMPIGCLRQSLRLGAEPSCPRDYIYALRRPSVDLFGRFAVRARSEAGWTRRDIDASHSANVTAPGLLMETIDAILGG